MAEPLRVALAGTGRIAYAHLRAYLDHPDRVRLVAVCDLDREAAERFAAAAHVDRIFTDYATMLREAECDAVDITTIHDQHAAQTIGAAAAGKHVLTEKAMAHSVSACREMIAACDAAGVTLMVAQNLRYLPYSAAVKRLIESGDLGRIIAARTHAILPIVAASPPGHWMLDGKRAGGGILMTNSIHHIDLLRYFMGNVIRVSGFCRTVQPELVNGAEDLVAASLEFENGAIADLFGNWTTHRSPEAMNYTIFGTDGTLHSTPPEGRDAGLDQFGPVVLSRKGTGGQGFRPIEIPPDATETAHCFVNEILHFEQCCRTGHAPLSSGSDNIETIRTIMAICESSRSGRAVDVSSVG